MKTSIDGGVVCEVKDPADTLASVLYLAELDERPPAEPPVGELFEHIERAKQEWEATADALPELICLIDGQGRIRRANRTVESWGLGAVVAVRGRDLHELMHPHCEGLFCYLQRFLQQQHRPTGEGQPAELEAYDVILKRHLRVRLQPVAVKNKVAPSTMAVVMQDITERKRAEEAQRRHTQRLEVMNAIEEAILASCSPEDIAQATLSRLRPLVPFRRAQVMLLKPGVDEFLLLAAHANGGVHLRPGRSFAGHTFRSREDRRPEKFFMIQDLATLADPSSMEGQLLREGIRAYVSLPLVAEGDFIGALSLGADQPDAFNPEHIDIAREVADLLAIATRQTQLYQQLHQANGELRQALRAKDEMVQNVSHELRSPLHLMCGYVDLLAGAELGSLTDEQAQAVQTIHQQTERLRFMVERLLLLQTCDAATLRRAPLDVGVWLQQVVPAWEVRLAQAGLQLELDLACGLSPLLADVDFLEQVLVNLLDNAVKFSPQGGVVRVRVVTEGERVLLAVSDQGIGMAPDTLARVFERFYQADGSRMRRFAGMGIGLALCTTIVEAHGGRLWAESAGLGQGSTFWVALPAGRSTGGETDPLDT